MIYCDKHFEKEYLKIEKWVKIIGIPFFTIMSTLFLTKLPFEYGGMHFIFHLIFSFIGIISIWFSVMSIGNYIRKTYKKTAISIRLILLITTSSITSTLIILILHYFALIYFNSIHELCPEDFDLKNLLLIAILLTFLIITLYESFNLFRRLSETALETERYKKESIEAQYQNLTSRLNPHFLFNSLNTLTTIVEEDSKKAVSYIQELSVVYRYVLNSHKSTWTDLPSELKFTQSYVTLLKMRFEENLLISMDICDKHMEYCILPLTIQLLIENAVKHNEISSKHPLNIHIYCTDEWVIVVNNKQMRAILPSSTKVGLHNINERYKFLVNKEIVIEDTETSFTIKVPLVKVNKEKGAISF